MTAPASEGPARPRRSDESAAHLARVGLLWCPCVRSSALLLLVLVAGLGLSGCSDECECPLGGTCDVAGRCTFECSVESDCLALACGQDEPCCDDRPACVAHRCERRPVPEDECGPPPVAREDNDGWSDPVGAGEAYVVSELTVAPDCPEGGGCIDAFASMKGILDRWFDGQILGGRTRLLLELHGRDAPDARFDRSLTVALYPGRDYDDPVLVYNDFEFIGDYPTCCEFYPDINEPGPATPSALRVPAQVVRGVLTTRPLVEALALPHRLNNDLRGLIRLREATLTGTLGPSGALASVDLAGRLLPGDLWQMLSAMCVHAPERGPCPRSLPDGARVIDLVYAAAGPPDADRDGDGLECLLDLDDDGLVDTCCDGALGGSCNADCTLVPPIHPSERSSCTLSPQMQDGYSVTLRARLVPATVYPSP